VKVCCKCAEKMEMTARQQLDELMAKPIPRADPLRPRRPRLVCVGGRVVADAVVIVSPVDRNWWVREDREIQVRKVEEQR